MGAVTLSSGIRLPKKMTMGSVRLPCLQHVMGLSHWWLLRVTNGNKIQNTVRTSVSITMTIPMKII
jgi:hypothetical protein